VLGAPEGASFTKACARSSVVVSMLIIAPEYALDAALGNERSVV